MTWYLYAAGELDDARFVSADVGQDVLRNNLQCLYEEGPASSWSPCENTDATGRRTAATDFADEAAILAKFPLVFVRGNAARTIRSVRFTIWAGITGGSGSRSGSLRVVVGPTFDVVHADPPVWPYAYADTVASPVSTTYAHHTLNVELNEEQREYLRLGSGFDYPCVCVQILGRVDSGGSSPSVEMLYKTRTELHNA